MKFTGNLNTTQAWDAFGKFHNLSKFRGKSGKSRAPKIEKAYVKGRDLMGPDFEAHKQQILHYFLIDRPNLSKFVQKLQKPELKVTTKTTAI